jgi:hypothetical protein
MLFSFPRRWPRATTTFVHTPYANKTPREGGEEPHGERREVEPEINVRKNATREMKMEATEKSSSLAAAATPGEEIDVVLVLPLTLGKGENEIEREKALIRSLRLWPLPPPPPRLVAAYDDDFPPPKRQILRLLSEASG